MRKCCTQFIDEEKVSTKSVRRKKFSGVLCKPKWRAGIEFPGGPDFSEFPFFGCFCAFWPAYLQLDAATVQPEKPATKNAARNFLGCPSHPQCHLTNKRLRHRRGRLDDHFASGLLVPPALRRRAFTPHRSSRRSVTLIARFLTNL